MFKCASADWVILSPCVCVCGDRPFEVRATTTLTEQEVQTKRASKMCIIYNGKMIQDDNVSSSDMFAQKI